MATVERTFLGWDSPAADAAAEWLLSLACGGELDLSRHVVATAGRRAGRVISSMLATRCDRAGLIFTQPRWITLGDIVDVLCSNASAEGRMRASEETRQLAYVSALVQCGSDFVRPLLPNYDEESGLAMRLSVAEYLLQVQDEVAREGMRIADALNRAQGVNGFESEVERWKVASSIQDRYETILESWGCFDAPLLNIRRSLDVNQSSHIERLVLVGVAELQKTSRDAISNASVNVNALVFAPESESSGFDSLGCVITSKWESRHAELQSEHVIIAENGSQQARCAFGIVAKHASNYASQDMVIGVPDEGLIPLLEFESEMTDSARVRSGGGIEFRSTRPGRLLELVAAHLEDSSWESLAALVRHPDLGGSVLANVARDTDEIHLVTQEWRKRMGRRIDSASVGGDAKQIVELIDAWLRPIEKSDGAGLSVVAPALMDLLKSVYGGLGRASDSSEDKISFEACVQVHDVAVRLTESPKAAHVNISALEFVKWVIALLRSTKISARQDDDAIEMIGWLELSLDPARVAIVAGMNEGFVPQSRDADPILPNGLREHLGLPCDRRRLARDMYILHGLKHSKDHVYFLAGRRALDGSPLKPSRLLLSEGADLVVSRLAEYARYEAGGLSPIPIARRVVKSGSENKFRSCPMIERPPLQSLAVTAFKDYLQSPYLFYVRHVLGVEEQKDPTPELDAREFGTLLHDTLNEFGSSDVKDFEKARDIEEFLLSTLQHKCGERFGLSPTGAVRLQLQSAGYRLKSFAEHQAQRRQNGWRILKTEWKAERATLEVDGEPFKLRGRIDRIDCHEDGRIAIWDYKSGDQAIEPTKDHGNIRTLAWTNLQLPLYRHLALELGRFTLEDQVELGYVLLPRDAAATAFSVAAWNLNALESADQCARQVVRDVRNSKFDELRRAKPGEAAIAGLCGVGQLGAAPPEPDDDGAGGDA